MMVVPLLLTEFDEEIARTRDLLARLPAGASDWRPHPRSFSLGQLAAHIVHVLGYARNLLMEPACDLSDTTSAPVTPYPTGEVLLEAFDRRASAARQMMATRSDADLYGPWQMMRGRDEIFVAPRGLVLRRFLLNHLIHHRGQMTVYLRMCGVTVPAVYGLHADGRA
jgi:uncharacterized damage-inducible protein DinB